MPRSTASTATTSGTSAAAMRNTPTPRLREQFSCSECFRRKQKCNRQFPCNHCIGRRLPDRCRPPAQTEKTQRGGRLSSARRDALHRRGHRVAEDDGDDTTLSSSAFAATDHNETLMGTLASIAARLSNLEDQSTRTDNLPSIISPPLSHNSLIQQQHTNNDDSQRTSVDAALSTSHSSSSWPFGSTSAAPPSLLENCLNVVETHTHDEPSSASSSLLSVPPPQQSPAYLPSESDSAPHATGSHAATWSISSQCDIAERWVRDPSAVAKNPFLHHLGPNHGLVVPVAHLDAIHKALPATYAEAQALVQTFYNCFNMTGVPLPASLAETRLAQVRASLPDGADHIAAWQPQSTLKQLPAIAMLLSIFVLGATKRALRMMPSPASRRYFYACNMALSLCECVGLSSMDCCRAYGFLAQYLDLVRVPRAAWLKASSCTRDAIDLGLNCPAATASSDQTLTATEARLLWLQALLRDREWSALYGRPLTYSTAPPVATLPTSDDFRRLHIDSRCEAMLRARAAFLPCIEAIIQLQQSLRAGTAPERVLDASMYAQVLAIDAQILAYQAALPPCLSSLLDDDDLTGIPSDPLVPFYRHLVVLPVLFFRILLYRPFMFAAIDMTRRTHPYPTSYATCISLALQSQRCLARLQLVLPPVLAAQQYGGAYMMFNNCIVLGKSIIKALRLDEPEEPASVVEKLENIHAYVTQVRYNLEEGIGDHFAAREYLVMRCLHRQLLDVIHDRQGSHHGSGGLTPFLRGRQARHALQINKLLDRISSELDLAERSLRQAEQGIRVDDDEHHLNMSTATLANDVTSILNYTTGSDPMTDFFIDADWWVADPLRIFT